MGLVTFKQGDSVIVMVTHGCRDVVRYWALVTRWGRDSRNLQKKQPRNLAASAAPTQALWMESGWDNGTIACPANEQERCVVIRGMLITILSPETGDHKPQELHPFHGLYVRAGSPYPLREMRQCCGTAPLNGRINEQRHNCFFGPLV
jgi:hypothetical protein